MKSPLVGILTFQGDFALHQKAFAKLNCRVQPVKSNAMLKQIDCLVIPGGESSTIIRFIHSENMVGSIENLAAEKPLWGSCAGMILLSREVANDDYIKPLGLIDMVTDRNAYGRQFDSFVGSGDFQANGKTKKLEMVFIRAPRVVEVGNQVEVLGKWHNEITIVKQGKTLATSFHPELSDSTRFQEYFLSLL